MEEERAAMNYKIKCAIQWAFSVLPGTHHLNRFMQLYMTRSLPISDGQLAARREIAEKHIARYTAQHGRRPGKVLDIGSGSDLSLAMLMAAPGTQVTASDIQRLASDELIRNMLGRLGLPSLQQAGVSYVVYSPPKLPFADASFDLITSTSVLEHVPRSQLAVLFAEMRRVLKPDGVCSHHIAHKDHWSDADPSIHWMNYVRFSERAWALHNPPVMFQNRVMSSEYAELFASAGFAFSVEKRHSDTPPPLVAPAFQRFSAEELSTSHSWFVGTVAV